MPYKKKYKAKVEKLPMSQAGQEEKQDRMTTK